MLAPDLRSEIRWLASGFLLIFCSVFGQTYYIALFAGHIKNDLAISDGQWGSLYTIGTISSAALLMWAGKLADRWTIRWLGVAVLSGLALTCIGMSLVSSPWMLAVLLFGLRFFGQGMSVHTAMTAMGRWFNRKRGRAVSIAAMGTPANEAIMPALAVGLIGLFGWRMTWVSGAVIIVVLAIPALILLLTHERTPTMVPLNVSANGDDIPVRQWTRGEVLRSPLFYAIMPGLLAPPFIHTGIFFNQVTLVELKGWELSWFAANFMVLAGVSVVSSLSCGWLVDRFGARRLLPFFLVPLGMGSLLLVYVDNPIAIPIFMALTGLGGGCFGTVNGALWAELYGTRHLGAIRSLSTSVIVFASALSPGLLGILLDAGVPLTLQLFFMSGYSFAAAVWMACLIPALSRAAPYVRDV